MLENPKARNPQRKDEKSLSVTGAKVEKRDKIQVSREMFAWCKPKQIKTMDNQQPRLEESKVQRLAFGVGCKRIRSGSHLFLDEDIV